MIAIVDYQMGNLHSAHKAVQKVGGAAVVTDDPAVIADAERVILPGVGAFGDCAAHLRERGLEQPIRDFVAGGRPFLGICVGLQLLFDTGYEDGVHDGLGILAGTVERIAPPPPLKVPHMGWNTLVPTGDVPLLAGVPDGSQFYFVHSYAVRPSDQSVVAATCDYGGDFCAMVWSGNVFATQFHPEKSQRMGLKLLENFVQWHPVAAPC